MYSVQVKTKQQLNLSERLNFVMKVLMMHHLLMSYVLEHKVCFHHTPATVNLYHNNKQKHGIWRWGSARRTFYSAHRDDCNSKIICLKSWNLLWKCSLLASYFCNYWSEVLKCFSFHHFGKHEVTSQETKIQQVTYIRLKTAALLSVYLNSHSHATQAIPNLQWHNNKRQTVIKLIQVYTNELFCICVCIFIF